MKGLGYNYVDGENLAYIDCPDFQNMRTIDQYRLTLKMCEHNVEETDHEYWKAAHRRTLRDIEYIMKNQNLTVLSFGGGQDSTAILYKMIYNETFRARYAPGDLLVVMADTMNEHRETYDHVAFVADLCKEAGIEFVLIHPEMGYTSEGWKDGLIGFYREGNRVGSKAFPKTCTDNLKIRPIYKYLDEWIHNKYGTEKVGRKAAIKEFVATGNKIDVLIGIGADEQTRASSNEESPSKWMQQCINKVYPLIDMHWSRQDCQDYIISKGMVLPPPSNCILCPFMSMQELLYMSRTMGDWFQVWVEIERNKLEANKHVENNMGVWGEKTLTQVLLKAVEKHGHMTTEELHEYKMSHGHCVKSKY